MYFTVQNYIEYSTAYLFQTQDIWKQTWKLVVM